MCSLGPEGQVPYEARGMHRRDGKQRSRVLEVRTPKSSSSHLIWSGSSRWAAAAAAGRATRSSIIAAIQLLPCQRTCFTSSPRPAGSSSRGCYRPGPHSTSSAAQQQVGCLGARLAAVGSGTHGLCCGLCVLRQTACIIAWPTHPLPAMWPAFCPNPLALAWCRARSTRRGGDLPNRP